MAHDPVVSALDRLAPAAHARAAPRLRIGVGAAVVLLIAALATAVVVSAVGQQSGHQVVAAAGAAGGTAPGTLPSATQAPGTVPSGAVPSGAQPLGATPSTAGATTAGAVLFVHVLGAVQRPGLYELSVGARVMDAVAAAGGLTETADPAGANLARRVADGEQLYLPQLGETPPRSPAGGAAGGGAGGGTGAATVPVNLNTATLAELDTLPRIGPAMAQRILDYRDANGPFASVDDLRNVTGIGDKTFEGLAALITV
ncbi:helix-hairpin-helix domain-containing protein [Cryobacterium sp. TMT1-21]|uniref:Helix-hairpin-helix domain-containing protein n=1 Tax=Cryobacterium shii TaxID=1259235 RepID=A0AAQ2C608_9MICO|nr:MULTISPECIES: helix-hairpin-helix domain-containing protein [Cryobacterium]TFC45876.1 helix-hairpin-helix domain-containing protein [Cryobacterium shii]TFC84407.1 helix-hairpin-helix domain-containing protein [Cryobacterium sp. TmT2-59]TFD08709.1 helix-hairpin-helix domain-containing protein [Cryobacterium sp. TMT1-21]TFD18499.1 helix-hairpin-helix domain-containing protein [Cryobacterium sp. TMT4-10]TFD26282.1 helix-hairpin-helix domain-containing protein [Cryobacterium sp. TMT2-23]